MSDVNTLRRWLWVDLETTGLGYDPADPQATTPDAILEVAAIITDSNLDEVSTFGPFPIAATDADLALMGDYVRNMHTETGLLERINAGKGHRLGTVDSAMHGWMSHNGLVKKVNLAGSSVKLDFEFIRRHMPQVFSTLGYRVIDVSSFKEALRDWMPPVVAEIEAAKAPAHKAMEDIRWSVRELRAYRQALGLGARQVAA